MILPDRVFGIEGRPGGATRLEPGDVLGDRTLSSVQGSQEDAGLAVDRVRDNHLIGDLLVDGRLWRKVTPLLFATTSTRRQRLVFESGRVSSMRTRSPTLASPFSS